ncbi:dipeptide ABC transporter ATP-binding protein [Amycolatopsis sp. NPDC051372]|uniref:dipeptide ABC transporter ATP-binding protein n=1 Tax=Amycolatopsis sp. NPDC051372 TaxID=3155669 RepID=UPI003429A964
MNSTPAHPVLTVSDLTVTLDLPTGPATAVNGVDLTIAAGEAVGMVGESGSGKSMTALAISRMLPSVGRISGGSIVFDGDDITHAGEHVMRRIRGGRIGMVFQDPLASLNPLMTVGAQITETLRLHGASAKEARRRAVELLQLVGIKNADRVVDDHPHEFSGGMRQRVMIAIAVANNPKLLIADEPTTALDVTIQAEILALLGRLRSELGTATLLITHDLGVVEENCDRVVVLYGGRIAETGRHTDVLDTPRHPYTSQLMRAVPRLSTKPELRLYTIPGSPPDLSRPALGCTFADRCSHAEQTCRDEQPPLLPSATNPSHLAACWVAGDTAAPPPPDHRPARVAEIALDVREDAAPVVVVDNLVIDYRAQRKRHAGAPAVDGVSLRASAGRTLGLVGESGCGKTSVSRAVAGLVPATSGSITIDGADWRSAGRADRVRMRRAVQMVFQDPYGSLNPRWRVRDIVSEPLRNGVDSDRGPAELLDLVGLPQRFLSRFPSELSGGQRQRVGIARALAMQPQIIVADEPVSALDVSVQAQVINLLSDLRDELDVGYVFVAHDLAVVRQVSDDLAVMYLGRIVEQGPAAEVFHRPRHPYTSVLMAAAPGMDRQTTQVHSAATAPPIDLSVGCRFRNRCPIGPLARADRTICETTDPQLVNQGAGHTAACHFAGELALAGAEAAQAAPLS